MSSVIAKVFLTLIFISSIVGVSYFLQEETVSSSSETSYGEELEDSRGVFFPAPNILTDEEMLETMPPVYNVVTPPKTKIPSPNISSKNKETSTKPELELGPMPTALGGVTPSTDFAYYTISGSTENELRAAMDNKKEPLPQSGFDGYTERYFTWKYIHSLDIRGCFAKEVYITVDTTIILPSWTEYKTASSDLQSKWTSYLDNLTLHEKGHENISIQGGQKIFEKMSNMGAYKNCQALKGALEGIYTSVLGEISQGDIKYDVETKHGRTQGAVFP